MERYLRISSDLNNENLEILFNEDIYLKGRPIALKRSFENIIQNGLSYGKKVCRLKKSSNRALIIFDDDGPEYQWTNIKMYSNLF